MTARAISPKMTASVNFLEATVRVRGGCRWASLGAAGGAGTSPVPAADARSRPLRATSDSRRPPRTRGRAGPAPVMLPPRHRDDPAGR